MTALFALENKEFTRHSAIRAAIHRDLVKSGTWQTSLDADYDYLMDIREMGDYGGLRNVSKSDAEKAVDCPRRIFDAVVATKPELQK